MSNEHVHTGGCCGEGQTSICIFSRNRPLQLHALLKSLKNVHPIRDVTVLYKYDEEYLPAMEEIKNLFRGYKFVEDSIFKEQVCSFLEDAGSNSLFLVDDIVFRRPVNSIEYGAILENNPQFLTFSLRMGLHLTRCYPVNAWQPLPDGNVQSNFFLWSWRRSQHDWNYPFSVDGNIFRTKQLLSWIKHLDFSTPNSFEEAMQSIQLTFAIPDMCICNAESALFNNPLNRVQDTHKNRSGEVSPEYLLKKWNEGLEIDIDILRRQIPNAAHFVVDLPYRKRAK